MACDSYDWNGTTYSTSGSYTQTLQTTNGCDSVVTLMLTINNSTTGTDLQTACNSYTWLDGNTYTSSNNTATHTLQTINGCDSVVTLNLTIINSATGTDSQTACDSFNWNGTTYSTSGSYIQTLSTLNGCDSVVTLTLTINNSTTGTDLQTACDSYTWIDGNTYSSSNTTATHTLQTVNGCDSLVMLNLTINNSTTGTGLQTACDSYDWNGTTYTTSGSYIQTLNTVNGCDSVVTLNLNINLSEFHTDSITACNFYTWENGITYLTNNNSAQVTYTNNLGCDSVITLNLNIFESSEENTSYDICFGDSVIIGNNFYSNSGIYVDTLTNYLGCDSIINTFLYVNSEISLSINRYQNSLESVALAGFSPYNFTWNTGDTISVIYPEQSGQYWVTAKDAMGCFSDTVYYNFIYDYSFIGGSNPRMLATPNPFSYETLVTFYNIDLPVDLELYDFAGNKVTEINNINSNEFIFENSNFSKGIYLLRIRGKAAINPLKLSIK